ncbi:CpsD/CapB family tyrosine-protein kinase [Sporosarcina sp. OR05]|uniref:CpsD/CapB family tyrosine-protein kinase n=1 Tax=Sporosarcina sp. OR05 TaxID=2969819 RepID=UPI00352A9538
MAKKNRSQNMARKLLINDYATSIFAEQFRSIRANINFSLKDKGLTSLLVTSSSVGEGKSTVAANIAISFAQEGKNVLLVDADLRKPTMHVTFNHFISPGLTNLFISDWQFEDVVKESGIEGLKLITSGPIPSNPAELLSSKSMNRFMKDMKGKFDMIIFDAPPLLSVADAQILAEKCEGTILVIRAGTTEKKNLRKAKEVLTNSKATVIGAILNHYKLEKNHYYYDYYADKE